MGLPLTPGLPICANGYTQDCPRGPECPGRSDVYACKALARLNDWRALGPEAQTVAMMAPADKAVLALVKACPDRGETLPPSLQPSCGCRELTACRAGKGDVPGQVTLGDCMACRAATLGPPAAPEPSG